MVSEVNLNFKAFSVQIIGRTVSGAIHLIS